MFAVYVLIAGILIQGCSSLPPSAHIVCKGKGTLTIMGGPYSGSIQGDCGDGFEYHRENPKDAPDETAQPVK